MNSYAAVKATNMLNDEIYSNIKSILVANEAWTSKLQELENELENIALKIV